MNLENFCLLLMFLVLGYVNTSAQCALREIPISEQIHHSNLIVEGRIIAQESFWDIKYHNIYTVNTLEVYKVFKGESVEKVEIITRGGQVGDKLEVVTPSLKLHKNQQGVFMLDTKIPIELTKKTSLLRASTYSSLQGFYKYNLYDNKVTSPFRKFDDIGDTFYNKIKNTTKRNFIKIAENKSLERSKQQLRLSKNKKALVITDISPTTVSAGTKTVLTIQGSGFGLNPGVIGFFNADDGGATFTDETSMEHLSPTPISTQIIKWEDDLIEVEVPDEAGTGNVRVFHNSDMTFATSSQILTVNYSQINGVTDVFTSGTDYAYQTQHINSDGDGGYTWQMFTGFHSNQPAKASFLRAFDTWRCATKINWKFDNNPTNINIAATDNTNVIRFDVDDELAEGVLGQCISRYSICPGIPIIFVSEMDIIFDDAAAGLTWQFDEDLPSNSEVDFESIAIHELGHGHQLGHVIDSNAIMHFDFNAGESNRELGANDIAGAIDVQNRSENNIVGGCSVSVMTPYNEAACTFSTDDVEVNDLIIVYPNPSKGIIYVNNLPEINLNKALIYDVSGRLINNYDLSKSAYDGLIDLSKASKGLYFINIYSDLGMTTKKIVLE